MGRHWKGSRPDTLSRRAPESGAAAVEFALLASLLFMLIFGSISAGISFSRSNALQTAAREGARYGVTLPGATAGASGWLDSVITTTHAAALGELNDGVPGRTICVAFVEADGTASSKTLTAAGAVSAISAELVQAAPCIAGDGLSDQRVQVVVARETEIQAVLFAIDITVSGDAVGRYERT